MVLGARLRVLREAQYISLEEAAEAIRVTPEQIAWLELGRVSCRQRDAADLLTIYSVHDPDERATLLALAQQTHNCGWWRAYDDVVPHWLHTYLTLEQAASVIRTYEVQFVPGLMQTREYARAVIALKHGITREAELDRRLELRMRRQQVLHGARPPYLWAVIDEAALRRPIGGHATMRAQLRHLASLCELPHVTIQVLPFRTGGHPAGGGSVSLLRLPEPELPDVVYLEQLISAGYPDEAEDIDHYRGVIDQLVTMAEPATATPALLHGLAERVFPEGASHEETPSVSPPEPR
ncbi:XRE family transcriptional regulator [Streptomyces oceani]|uniref:XRE family transcriptional regulator n=2 Tax=Streptomyces oceani TaxID=1075402 RepID=A0A1E7JMM1_9ACTN|nr:XRE family transcriptional regulator [Streptomyces oceani]